MLTAGGRVGQPSVSNVSLDTKLLCKGDLHRMLAANVR